MLLVRRAVARQRPPLRHGLRAISGGTNSPEAGTIFSPLTSTVDLMHSVFDGVHAYTGLPWWAVIVGTGVSLRVAATFPFKWHESRKGAAYEKAQAEFVAERTKIAVRVAERAGALRMSEREHRKTLRKATLEKMNELSAKHGSGRMMFLPFSMEIMPTFRLELLASVLFLQLPLFVVMSLAIRRLVAMPLVFLEAPALPAPGMSVEGLLWLSDLTVPDPYLICPLVSGAAAIAALQIAAFNRPNTLFQKTILNGFAGMICLMTPLFFKIPAGLSLYIAVSALTSLCQVVVFKVPWTRRLMGIPEGSEERNLIWNVLGKRIREAWVARSWEVLYDRPLIEPVAPAGPPRTLSQRPSAPPAQKQPPAAAAPNSASGSKPGKGKKGKR